MKGLIRSIIYGVMKFFFVLINPNTISKLCLIRSYIYTAWISNSFNKFGKHSLIFYPLKLIGGSNVSIGNNFCCSPRLRIEAIGNFNGISYSPQILIGNNVTILYDCHIGAINLIKIGNNVLMGSKILITDHSHGTSNSDVLCKAPNSRLLYSKGPVVIEDNVWIGEGVVILPGVTIGMNSIVGANAVVTSSFPANSVIGGNPARLIKELN